MRRDEDLLSLFKRYRPGNIATVPPVVAEIEFGLQRLDMNSKKYLLLRAQQEKLLGLIAVLAWTPDASRRFGKIKFDLASRGELIDDFDIAIAAIAMSHQCGVITANVRHFSRVDRLQILSW